MHDFESLHTAGYKAARIVLKKSSIAHKDAGQVVFIERPVSAGEGVGYYYGHLCSLILEYRIN